MPPKDPLQPPEDSRNHVKQCNAEKHLLREKKDQCKQTREQDDQPERMARTEVDVFETVKAPRTHHKVSDGSHHRRPRERRICRNDRVSAFKMHNCSDHPGARRYRHANKIFLAGTSGIRRLGIARYVEAGQTARPCNQKKKTCDCAELRQLDMPLSLRQPYLGHQVKSPGPCQHGWSNAKRDRVGERIEFLAEIAGGSRHPGNASIETIK